CYLIIDLYSPSLGGGKSGQDLAAVTRTRRSSSATPCKLVRLLRPSLCCCSAEVRKLRRLPTTDATGWPALALRPRSLRAPIPSTAGSPKENVCRSPGRSGFAAAFQKCASSLPGWWATSAPEQFCRARPTRSSWTIDFPDPDQS